MAPSMVNSDRQQPREPEMNTEIRELNDAELEAVSGGMTCQTARMVALIHLTTATALYGLGQTAAGDIFLGKAGGVVDGGCK
jgi:hypothetical protein